MSNLFNKGAALGAVVDWIAAATLQ